MKRILVAVKRVIDYNARIRIKADKVWLGRPRDILPYCPRTLLMSQPETEPIQTKYNSQKCCPLQSGVEMTNVKMSMNPFCEIAVEVGRCTGRTERTETTLLLRDLQYSIVQHKSKSLPCRKLSG